MRWLFPSRAPFIPAKRPSFPLNSLFLPPEIAHLPQENEIFLPLVSCLLTGK